MLPVAVRVPKEFSANMLLKMKPRMQSKLFFQTMEDIENFMLSFEVLIHSVINKETAAANGSVSNSPIASSNILANSPMTNGGNASNKNMILHDPKYIITVYEMMNAMEGLYEFLFRFSEDWSADIKAWLVRSLKIYMTLPIEQPEILKIILNCLARENKLFSPEIIQVVQQVIADSFDDPVSTNVQNAAKKGLIKPTLASVLRSVNRMVDTLNYVIGDLIPILPQEFNVIKMFTDHANIKIKEDITSFYYPNKADIGNKDLLTLLSFADKQVCECIV